MRNKMRKQYQKSFNKLIHGLNRSIEKDNLWNGRFVFYQKDATWWQFPDNSGGEMRIIIRAYDKKNDYYHDYIIDFAPWLHARYWVMYMEVANKFIVEDDNVWVNDDIRPYDAPIVDYTKKKINFTELMQRPANYYTPYKK